MEFPEQVNPLFKSEARNILITGASSGIGFQASNRLLKSNYTLILPCRDKASSDKLLINLERNKKIFGLNRNAFIKSDVMDLSDFKSIRIFTDKLLDLGAPIDCLVLNAGLQYTGSKYKKCSAQGIELTFAVNHLGHQYLTQKILPLLLKSNNPKVIITSSEVHNPKSSGGRIGAPASLGKLNGLKKNKFGFDLLDGESTFNADKAYKDSKLCNILFARQLYRRIVMMGRDIPVIAWAPGLVIPRTNRGFFRYSRTYNELGQILFAFLARDLLRITESVENAGDILKSLIQDFSYKEPSFKYFSNSLVSPGKYNFQSSEISNEAKNDRLGEELWELSSQIINQYETTNKSY